MSCSDSTRLASAGCLSDNARQARALDPQGQASSIPDALIDDAIIDDPAAHAPLAGLEIRLSAAMLGFTVVGAIMAYLMWVSGPGFLVLFVLLLFASRPFNLKGLNYLASTDASIDRKMEV
ncbi:hypothetical protein [Pararhizobium sp. IMCC21322]|uniref:hypothetical protein n=1 Tax=Pararhizobium sp. IMCC21322 TaxID=3067903 RepID=UPI0027424F44|nr:hypothetical protein [Pararhizobium sp. IMCC21322]